MGTLRGLFKDRMGSSQEKTFAGENFRMSEFTGAVLGAQLPKLDEMIRQLRRHAEAIHEGIKDLDGIQFRYRPDPKGDIGYAVYFRVKDRATRDRGIRELRKRNVPASTLTGSVLLPIQESVINKRGRHPRWPSFTTERGKAIHYGRDCCRQTLETFDTYVQVRIGVKYTSGIDDHIVRAIREVYPTLR
jgi:8-amino-3,8-dideoxy-alpha-D-manno-octulosonate transaminase